MKLTNEDIQEVAQGEFIDEVAYNAVYRVRTFTFRLLGPAHNMTLDRYFDDILYCDKYEGEYDPYGRTEEEWKADDDKRRAKVKTITDAVREHFGIDEGEEKSFCITRVVSEIFTAVAIERLNDKEVL